MKSINQSGDALLKKLKKKKNVILLVFLMKSNGKEHYDESS